jgi:hypothetical protein
VLVVKKTQGCDSRVDDVNVSPMGFKARLDKVDIAVQSTDVDIGLVKIMVHRDRGLIVGTIEGAY